MSYVSKHNIYCLYCGQLVFVVYRMIMMCLRNILFIWLFKMISRATCDVHYIVWRLATFQWRVHGVCIFQLIWYYRACISYHDFLNRGLLLTRKLLNQWFLVVMLESSLEKFCFRHNDLVYRYRIGVINDHGYVCSNHSPFLIHELPPGLQEYHEGCHYILK